MIGLGYLLGIGIAFPLMPEHRGELGVGRISSGILRGGH